MAEPITHQSSDAPIVQTYIGNFGEEHIQFGLKCSGDKEVKAVIVDVLIDPITRKISSRRVFLDTKSGASNFRHESAQMDLGMPKVNTAFVTRELSPAFKDSMGWSNKPDYTVGLAEYDVAKDSELNVQTLLNILRDREKILEADHNFILEHMGSLDQKAERAMTARPFKIPLETPIVKITRTDEKEFKGLLISVKNMNPESPVAAVIMRVHNVEFDENHEPKTPDQNSPIHIDYFYVPRDQKRGNFTGDKELDAIFYGRTCDNQTRGTRGLGPVYTALHRDFLQGQCGVSNEVDIGAFDSLRGEQLFLQVLKKSLLHKDTAKQIKDLTSAMSELLYSNDGKWKATARTEKSRIIMP